MIAAKSYVLSRMPFGASLTDDDVAGNDGFPAEFFNAEPLTAGVASVLD